MTRILSIDKSFPTAARPLNQTTLEAQGWTEPRHLERWLTEHIDVLDETLMIITTQFARWESDSESAKERLDILALSSSGELVVVELKRGSDPRVHLQALTYAALVSGFTLGVLAEAHATWLSNRAGTPVAPSTAEALLKEHVADEWDDTLLSLPRIMLVAENFPGQVITTLQWLSTAAPQLNFEAHQYTAFDRGSEVDIAFQQLWPVEDMTSRILRPGTMAASSEAIRERLTEKTRRARSVAIIHDAQGIPNGARIDLELSGMVRPEFADAVNAWLDEDAQRRDVRWVSHATKPLTWAGAEDPDQGWTPSALRNELFLRAGVSAPSFSAADAWSYNGLSFYLLAERLVESDSHGD